jgi:hypothetical protein
MLASMVLVTALLTDHSEACSKPYYDLYNASSRLADLSHYAEAAALREGAAHLFDDCLANGAAPRDGMYPFDGVGAYLLAATFWHLAGQSTEAERTLLLARTSLQQVLRTHPESELTDAQRLYLYQMRRLIQDDGSGKWAVWKE